MGVIKLHDKFFKPFISQEGLANAVKRMAERVKVDLNGEVPIFVGIMNGSFVFAADFIRAFAADCEVSFVKLASYSGENSSGTVKRLIGY